MRLRPTSEQQAILAARGHVVKINARAGTGKTTTLRMLAETRSKVRGLYLVFNKRAQLRAERDFPRNVEVRTVHSLAYACARRDGLWRLQTTGNPFTEATFLPAYADHPEIQHELSALSHAFLSYFMNAPHERLEQAVSSFGEELPAGQRRESFEMYSGRIVDECRALLAAWHNGRLECPHDFYLKLAHRTGRLQRKLAGYDMLLVDEGQDLSEIMLDLLLQCPQQIFIVGDTHQGIYGFRYAVDAMLGLPADEQHELTVSFRFGKALARLASLYIREAKGVRGFNIRGRPDRVTEVAVSDGLPFRRLTGGSAVLARTNMSLFETAVELYEAGRPLQFERAAGPLLQRVQDTLWLHTGRRERIEDPFIAAFGSLSHMEEYADRMGDGYLLSLTGIVRRHGPELGRTLRGLSEYSQRCRGLPSEELVTLSTVHSAKGQEYRAVFLHDDIPEYFEQSVRGERSGSNPDEEANVGYVAITRAVRELHLPQRYAELFSSGWQRHLRTLQGRAEKPRERSRRSFRVGERVLTRLGPGIVEHVSPDGQKADVLLEEVGFSLTERLAELRRAD